MSEVIKSRTHVVLGNSDYYEALLEANGNGVNIRASSDLRTGKLEVRVQNGQKLNWDDVPLNESKDLSPLEVREKYDDKVRYWEGKLK